jgi:carbamoyl-phosphate synthase large subunit
MNVAVTGLNATDNPGPGVPVIRSLRSRDDFDGRIIGLLYDTLEPGAYMEHIADHCYLMPYPSVGLEAMYDRIAYIHEREKLDVILPTLDTELYIFSKLAPRMAQLGIRILIPSTEQLLLRGKDRLAQFCKDHNLRAPKTSLASSQHDLQTQLADASFPLMIKGIFYDAYTANSFAEAMVYFDRVRAKWGLPIIVQEKVLGDEFNVVALGDGTGRVCGCVAMRKTYVTDKGKGWAGITIYDPILLTLARTVLEKMKWTGGAELEFIKSRTTGEFFLLEINPRFPSWVFLATAAGQNLPAAWMDLTVGKDVATMTDYKIGTMFVRGAWDMISDVSFLEQLSTAGEISTDHD